MPETLAIASLPHANPLFAGFVGSLPQIPDLVFCKTMFDFDATLPLMALQFVVLAFLLNAIFYKPLNKVLDERADYIRTNEEDARERLATAKSVTQ